MRIELLRLSKPTKMGDKEGLPIMAKDTVNDLARRNDFTDLVS
jgi:hypothetical protein